MNLDLILALHLITVDNSHDSQGSKDQLENWVTSRAQEILKRGKNQYCLMLGGGQQLT